MEWKDISSYSRSDTDRTPKTWALQAEGLKIVVTRHVNYAPDAWLLCCQPFCEYGEIGTGTADEAKAAAVEYVRKNLELCLAAPTHN